MYEIHMEKLKVGAPGFPVLGPKSAVAMEPTGRYEVFTATDEGEVRRIVRSLEQDGAYALDSVREVPLGTARRRKYTLSPEEAEARAIERIREHVWKEKAAEQSLHRVSIPHKEDSKATS
jgi:hypothetical protein